MNVPRQYRYPPRENHAEWGTLVFGFIGKRQSPTMKQRVGPAPIGRLTGWCRGAVGLGQ